MLIYGKSISYRVIKTFPHDTSLFTEGLLVHECRSAQRIAYDAKNDKVYVTGKLWPTVYEISF